MKQEWLHLRDIVMLANHQATRYEATRRHLSSFLQTTAGHDGEFLDRIIDPPVLEELLRQHPGAQYEELAKVAPLTSFYSLAGQGHRHALFNTHPQVQKMSTPKASSPPPSYSAGTSSSRQGVAPPSASSAGASSLSFGAFGSTTPSSFAPPPTFGGGKTSGPPGK